MVVLGEAFCRTVGGICASALEIARESFGGLDLAGRVCNIGLKVAFSMVGC